MTVTVSIAGGSGYVGGELIRLVLLHPEFELQQITSERYAGTFLKSVHPVLRGVTDHKFCSINELNTCDLLFLCLPHGKSMSQIEEFRTKATKIIDLSADFRLNNLELYERWYGPHTVPDLLASFVYGIPELHRSDMRGATLVSSAGCNATSSILALYPLVKNNIIDKDRIMIDAKVGTSEAGNHASFSSHHPERVRSMRSYKPTSHRHVAEISQELGVNAMMSATSVDQVRGVLVTIQTFLKDPSITEKDIWKVYRKEYKNEPFIRIVKSKTGNFRYPDPKTLVASNFCDVGFELEPETGRLVVLSALDNLMKGAAGQALQAANILFGFPETQGLEFPGIYLY